MQRQKILLVEPKAKTSYPPMGLMKIATYHHLRGDSVTYVSGKDSILSEKEWSKIYITSVFTYNYSGLVDCIKYYAKRADDDTEVLVGGIAATLLADKLEEEVKIKPHRGLLNSEDPFLIDVAKANPELSYLNSVGASIDNLPPDYGLFPEDSKYQQFLDKSYFFFSTKGCPNKCGFCAVKTLEPDYVDYIPLMPRIKYVARTTGSEKAGLLLLDNNIAASESYFRILDEIKDCGFGKGQKLAYRKDNRTIYRNRFVDFNQGVDLRLMTLEKMRKMGEIAIAPLRLAFDNISLSELYEEKMELAISCGITNLSNYMLYNYKDTPEDLYNRFKVNLRILKRNKGVKIFSFPMRYSPIERIDRKYIGKNWTKREIRAVQLVLQATHGIVSHKLDFFSRAFGRDLDKYREVLLYPYHYIINRDIVEYDTDLLELWERDFSKLSKSEIGEFRNIIMNGPLKEIPQTSNGKINRLLQHYEGESAQILSEADFALKSS